MKSIAVSTAIAQSFALAVCLFLCHSASAAAQNRPVKIAVFHPNCPGHGSEPAKDQPAKESPDCLALLQAAIDTRTPGTLLLEGAQCVDSWSGGSVINASALSSAHEAISTTAWQSRSSPPPIYLLGKSLLT